MEDPLISQATALLDSCTDELLQLLSRTDGWFDLGSHDGVTGAHFPNSEGILQVRTQCIINKPVEEVRVFLWEFSNKPRWDERLKEIRMIKSLGHNLRIMYEQVTAHWPISNRDFVYAQRFIETSDGFMIISKSIDAVVPENKGVVRAEIVQLVMYLKRIGDGSRTELTNIGCMNPKGSIPTRIVGKSARRHLANLAAVKRLLS